jgi:hypothetical protein
MPVLGLTLEAAREMTTIQELPWWAEGIDKLRGLNASHGDEARQRANDYAVTYCGQRAAMVFDVVASRQRRYTQRVLPMVELFMQSPAASSLRSLAEHGPGHDHGLRQGEPETMQQVAQGFVRYLDRHRLSEEDGVREWALGTSPFEHAPKLEPYIGSVKGMGPALFAYLRMRSGADALKPDLRVRDGLDALGFAVPNDAHAILVVAHAAAEEVGLALLVLDQLLWWAGEER